MTHKIAPERSRRMERSGKMLFYSNSRGLRFDHLYQVETFNIFALVRKFSTPNNSSVDCTYENLTNKYGNNFPEVDQGRQPNCLENIQSAE